MSEEVVIRPPVATDGAAVHRLIAECPPLDTNSMYCNLLQCEHFSGTCAVAERGGEVVGFLSGYIEPARPDTLFVWQVAVHASARGQGLAKRLLLDVLARPQCGSVRRIETTITEDNRASWALFAGIAAELEAPQERRELFNRETHFHGTHDSEILLCIGPFESTRETAKA